MRKLLFPIREFLVTSRKFILSLINRFLFYVSLIALVTIVWEYGFEKSETVEAWIHVIQLVCLFGFGLGQLSRVFFDRNDLRRGWFDPVVGLLGMGLIVINVFFSDTVAASIPWFSVFVQQIMVHVFLVSVFVIELGKFIANAAFLVMNPGVLFVNSFLLLILIGAGLLMLPNSTREGISVLDAVFTATSAVCVTGLVVKDTAADFTLFGQSTILFLIQLGGLGIMTFTTFFGYFFQGSYSLRNQLYMKDLLSEENTTRVFSTLVNVVLVTFGLEASGAVFIYFSVDASAFGSVADQWYFSVFHAISAFCNAGFSTLPEGMFNSAFRFNYGFQLLIAVLVIFGGLGFPIMFNYLSLAGHGIKNFLRGKVFRKKVVHSARILNLTSRIVMVMTAILLLLGWGMYMLLEFDNTLAPHSGIGKVITAFFASVTPRTAGFNTVNLESLATPTILLYLFLMWVGASPGSTGGGIKTTAFGLACLNVLSLARAGGRLELFRRRIADDSIKRALAIVFLSILCIGFAAFLLTITEPKVEIQKLLFEAFSAFGTAGLSMGVTASLSTAGKVIVMACMFMGRVGTLTIIIALFGRVKSLAYEYPAENIIVT